jgi:hypothetical protein
VEVRTRHRQPQPSFALVNYFRDINVTQIKYRLLADAVNQPS